MNKPLDTSDEELDMRARRIDLAHEPDFALGPVRVQPSLRKIWGPDGELMLEPKVMQVLVALATPQGGILSRDDLIERCWEGRVVGDTSINRVISLLRSGFKNVAGDAVIVENVPKVGYRLMVSGADAVETPQEDARPDPAIEHPSRLNSFGWKKLAAAAAIMLAVVAASFALWPSAPEAPVRPLRIAMLPMTVGEEVDPLYAKGFEAELRTQLARVGKMEVTSSETARQLFEEGLSAAEICRRLGADFAWMGSLKVGAERVSLSARLIDAANKQTTFQEDFTSAPESAQYLPIRTARAISSSLGRPVSGRMPESDVSASDFSLYLTALGLIKSRGMQERIAAHSILEQVTQGSPDFADGWAGLAKANYLYPWSERSDLEASRKKALEIARHALSLDPDALDALKVAGMLDDDPDKRLALLNRAVEVDPGDSEAWFWLSITRRDFLLKAQDPLEAATRMAQLDPLWPASWRAADLAAEFGDMDKAYEIERTIRSAAVSPSQQLLSDARTARMKGDFSQFVVLSNRAASTQTAAERRYGATLQKRIMRIILGLPPVDEEIAARESPPALLKSVLLGQLPTRAQMEAEGMDAERFWRSPTFLIPALPLFFSLGREDELLELYDEEFANHRAFTKLGEDIGQSDEIVPALSPFIALALRNAGRESEAQEHLRDAEDWLARWKAADTDWLMPVIWDLHLAAVKKDNQRAIAAVRKLPEYGWPYMMGHIDALSVGLVSGNPILDEVRKLPEVREVLDPIRANLDRERREVLALET
ncbi:hypothetical protein CD351_11800 [Erythrobacter sp. KY5]|uniref:winged helix-turn-helix domain-containing protein n=1 Tax=Erythrobacter sp. KY5 TaxID=2011159 RepID=UPI000DBEFBCE|nr:winged helix-turn-helix domain-containing protein [Erythrobacter sp. KY5]AWW75111.1 hypothetical protein CD351_11800 [Erythrobacter sp. KY5]